MGVLIAFFVIVLLVDTLIFWAFVEVVRDKEFSEGIGIGEAFIQCGIASLLGIGVRLMGMRTPYHLFYLFRPFAKAGLNFLSQILCLIIMGAAEFGIMLVMAKPLAAALRML